MIKLALFILFLYLLVTYSLRWFVVSNSAEFIKQHKEINPFADFSHRAFPAIFDFSLEYCSYLLSFALLLADYFYHYLIVYFKSAKTSKLGPNNQPPILLLHGCIMRGGTLFFIQNQLQKDGWNPVYTWNYMPPFKNIPYYAEKLKDKVDEILRRTTHTKITLICHSMGGLIARYYINFLEGKSSVDKLITLGTPHKGTQLWSFSYNPCVLDMRPGSDFLKKLRAIPLNIKVLSIYSSFDAIVLPYRNSILKRKNVVNKEFDNLWHMRLIFSPKVYEEIRSFLLKDDPFDL